MATDAHKTQKNKIRIEHSLLDNPNSDKTYNIYSPNYLQYTIHRFRLVIPPYMNSRFTGLFKSVGTNSNVFSVKSNNNGVCNLILVNFYHATPTGPGLHGNGPGRARPL